MNKEKLEAERNFYEAMKTAQPRYQVSTQDLVNILNALLEEEDGK